MASNSAKKSKAAAAEDDYTSEHDEKALTMEKLEELQEDISSVVAKLCADLSRFLKVDEKANQKMLQIEQEYNEMKEGYYVVRNEIIKSIPNFWLTVFMNHPKLGNLLNEEDQKIFAYLYSLDVKDSKDPIKGYCIIFDFKANPYFENTMLTKTVKVSDEGILMSTGTTIHWKEGKGPAECSSAGGKGNKRPRPLESFFSWFSYPPEDTTESVKKDEVAELIKEDIWPNPIVYFNNEDDEDYDEDEDDDEEEEDEEDETYEEDDKGKGKDD